MQTTNSHYLFLGTAMTIALIALFWLPQVSTSAVSIEPRPHVEPAAAPVEIVAEPMVDMMDEEPIRKVVDQMPLWPGCEDAGSYPDRKACADKKMMEYIYANVSYPTEAKENGVEGMSVVSFVVEKDGRVTGATIIRDPGAGTGAEALRVVNSMAENDIYWVPGRHEGKPVRVQFNLPVQFKLQ